MGLHLSERFGLKFGGLSDMGPISKCLIYQFADDVTYHDMTFLYPLSIIRRYNHPVIAYRSELSSSRAGEGYCLRSDSPGFLNAFDDVR